MLRRDWMMTCALALMTALGSAQADEEKGLRIATFEADATPPLGAPLSGGARKPAVDITTPLAAKGNVLLGAGEPIVLCAVDWIGIGNESYDQMRKAIAEAVGTSPDRVALHTLHQHDAPGSDFAAERLLEERGLGGKYSHPEFDTILMKRLASAAKGALARAKPVTHMGLGKGKVEKVASNRRVLGPDGKVAIVRWSASKSPAAQSAPEGLIDPYVHLISFWNDEEPLAVLTYYATHPQSYYGQGNVNWDFVGIAREQREEALGGLPHLHFDGAGGNVTAGKYNDGSPERRPILADRLAKGMKAAWDSQKKQPLKASEVGWKVEPVRLPPRATLSEESLLESLDDPKMALSRRIRAARDLSFLRRMQGGHRIPIQCLRLDDAYVLHLPGELFVEYQLAAQQRRPDDFVAMAAYGDYGPGYIGTEVAYTQGGYETGIVSRVDPGVEAVLMKAIKSLLDSKGGDKMKD
ncbi:hypothetical protein Pan216_44610 [Planctomycetes bacterium Pan216]|uniref:Neutral/alkaline non-lysosomal ceramidase n=1 Tax=Kolteria novifilia TaxID=2527975 RepID=A0A518B9B6_9BACT|nr:hypothetical protein Pan216_44610 [Planctomycetes bacterium Pan216]